MEKMSPDMYGGTPLLGVKGARVIVGHGSSNETAVKNGIAVAAATVRAHDIGHRRARGLRARVGGP